MNDSLWPWVLRALWVTLPFTAGRVFGDALDATSTPVETLGTLGLWCAWTLGMLLVFIPHTMTLTPARILAPAALAGTIWATFAAGTSAWAVAGLTLTALTSLVALSPQLGAAFVNGSSYGDERRLPLRPPGPLVLGPIPVFWALVVAGIVAGPALLAARQWIAGGIVTLIGFPVAAVAARSLHSLARRWLVFVPAGLVVHDHMSLADPVLFKRSAIARFGPALADSSARDLSQAALGLALELELLREVELAWKEHPREKPRDERLEAVIVSPSRPGTVLDEAKRRRITVG